MSEAKKRGASAAVDREEAKARAKMVAAIDAWVPLRKAQNAITGAPDDDNHVTAAATLAEEVRSS
jgi:hypothetical protein